MRDLSSTPVSRAIRLIIPRAMSLSICLRTTTLARAGFDLFIHPTEWQGLQRNSSQLSPLKEMPSCGKAEFSSSCSVASLVKLNEVGFSPTFLMADREGLPALRSGQAKMARDARLIRLVA